MLVLSRTPGQSIVGQSISAEWIVTILSLDRENQSATIAVRRSGHSFNLKLERNRENGIGCAHEISPGAKISLVAIQESGVRIGVDADESYVVRRLELCDVGGSVD